MDWVRLLEVIGGLAVAVITWVGVRWIQPRLRPRAKLKTDLEILGLLDSKKQKKGYDLVAENVDRTISEIYASPIKELYESPGKIKEIKISRGVDSGAITLGILGFIGLLGFSYWTWYIVSDGFSWWSILTGYLALVSFGMIVTAIERQYKHLSEDKADQSAASKK